ncbi:hypothetical protein ACOS73_00024505 (plasmid) [Escherichia coli]|uniref:hypothetical protein n=1 Tax=Escherichia coli TaxID=562 RepID=UPI003F93BD36
MTSLKTSIKTITYLSDIGCLEIQGASLATDSVYLKPNQSGVRAAECEDFVFSHRVKAFICLDDDESLFPVGYPHLQKTNYYTGLTESDLAALNTRYHLLMKRWAS